MSRLAFILLPLGALATLGACGDDGAQGGSGPGSGPSGPVTTGKNTGGGSNSSNGGDCSTNSECAPNGTCVPLTPNGFRTCSQPPVPSTECGLNTGGEGGAGGDGMGGSVPSLDECCSNNEDLDCNDDAACIRTPLYPTCGTPPEPPHNVCSDDANECDNSADCSEQLDTDGICLPAGVFGSQVRKCVRISCALDSECTAQPGGRCVPVEEECCAAIRGLYCTYEGSACRGAADCPGGYCQVNAGVASCVSGTPAGCN